MTRRGFGGAIAGSLVVLGASALLARRPHRSAEHVVLDEEALAGLVELARGVGAPVPAADRLAGLRRRLSGLASASPLLAAEYLRLYDALARLSKQAAISLRDWNSPASATALLGLYYAQGSGDELVRYAGRVLPRADVALKDMLVFLAGEPTDQIEVLHGLEREGCSPLIGSDQASRAFGLHCAACHQPSDVPGLDSEMLKALIAGGPVMSSRADLMNLSDSQLAVASCLGR